MTNIVRPNDIPYQGIFDEEAPAGERNADAAIICDETILGGPGEHPLSFGAGKWLGRQSRRRPSQLSPVRFPQFQRQPISIIKDRVVLGAMGDHHERRKEQPGSLLFYRSKPRDEIAASPMSKAIKQKGRPFSDGGMRPDGSWPAEDRRGNSGRALDAVNGRAKPARTSISGKDPGTLTPRGGVTHMLTVSAFEVRNPISLIVLIEGDDLPRQLGILLRFGRSGRS